MPARRRAGIRVLLEEVSRGRPTACEDAWMPLLRFTNDHGDLTDQRRFVWLKTDLPGLSLGAASSSECDK